MYLRQEQPGTVQPDLLSAVPEKMLLPSLRSNAASALVPVSRISLGVQRVRMITPRSFAKKVFLFGHALHSRDRKSTRLNSSHGYISYAVFCLKKKKKPL